LEQALVNLLTNAADAMARAPVKPLHIESEEHEDRHVLKI
jgi:C4-dicarboxylate-specific signal transduction histidine kinase